MKSLQKAALVPQSKFSCHATAGTPGPVHFSFPDIQGVCRSVVNIKENKSYDDSVKLKRTEMDPFRLG